MIENSGNFYENSLAVVGCFDPHMVSSDWIIFDDDVMYQLASSQYQRCRDGPIAGSSSYSRATATRARSTRACATPMAIT